MYGLRIPRVVPELISSLQWSELVVEGMMAVTMAFVAYTGWREVGVIDPRVWRSYLLAFPALASVGLLGAVATAWQ